MSRAHDDRGSHIKEELAYRVPDPPGLGRAIREALIDFFYNSWRLVPANLLWGIGLLIVIGLLFSFPFLSPLAAVLLAVPAAGIFRLATLIVRGEPVAFRDSLTAWRRYLGPALLSGLVLTAVTLLLGFNLVIGVVSREPLLWVIATLAGWALIATWAVALPFWALLTDPVREGVPLRARLRTAALLVLISPVRFGILLVLMTAVLILSTIFFAALLTISIAFIALVVTRYSLPAADRLEQRTTQPVPG